MFLMFKNLLHELHTCNYFAPGAIICGIQPITVLQLAQ